MDLALGAEEPEPLLAALGSAPRRVASRREELLCEHLHVELRAEDLTLDEVVHRAPLCAQKVVEV